MSTIYLRGIREDIVRKAKALAAQEGITLKALVERSIEVETQKSRPAESRLSEIARDIDWFDANKAGLLAQYEGQYVAVLSEQIVDHDHDVEALAMRVTERYGWRTVYIPRCQRSPRVIDVRSPRVVR